MARISTWATPLSSCRRAVVSASLILLTSAGSAGAAVNEWTSSGPTSSVINTIIFSSQSTPNSILVGTNGGGIYTSVDDGVTWASNNNGISTSTVVNTLRRCVTTNNIYAGTNGSGAYISTNSGSSWTAINNQLPVNSKVTSLALKGAVGTDLYAGINGNGVYKSTDNGSTWGPRNGTGLSNLNIRSVCVVPTGGTMILAGTFGGGMFYSTNDGSTWNAATGLPASITVNSIVVDNPDTPTAFFAGTSGHGVYTSVNGTTWVAANTGIESLSVERLVYVDNPEGVDDELYALTDAGIFRSTNAGTGWTALNTGLATLNSKALAIDPSAAAKMFIGTSSGIFKTVDSGASWGLTSSGLEYLTDIKATAIEGAHPTNIYSGGSGSGAFKSDDSAGSWDIENSGLGNATLNTLLPLDTYLYAGTNTGVFRTSYNPVSWNAVNTGANLLDVRALAFDSTSSTIYAGTGNGVYKTAAGAINWSATTPLGNQDIRALAIDIDTANNPPLSSVIYAGTGGGGVFKSTNGGLSWSTVNEGLTNTTVLALAADSGNPARLYAGTSDGLFKSTNEGISWIRIGNSFSISDIRSLAISANSGLIFAGTNTGGAYVSGNTGDSWLPINTGLPTNPVVQALTVDSGTPKRLYAGLAGQGVAAITLTPTIRVTNDVTPTPGTSLTSLDYGTVFNNSTTTKTLKISNFGYLPLNILDISGFGGSYTPSPGGSSQCSSFPIIIEPLSHCTTEVVFHPTTVGPKPDSLNIVTEDNLADTQISLTGNSIELTATISTPAAGAYLYGPSVIIEGTAFAAGTALQAVEISTNSGTSWTAATGTTSWSYNSPLSTDGPYTIQVRARDTAGNYSAISSRTVKVNNVLPVSAITSPAHNARLPGGLRSITGTAADTGADVKQVEVAINGGAWNLATGTNNWDFSWTPTDSGTYTIQSKATDNDDKVQAPPFPSVTVVIDTLPPTTAITAPVNNAILTGTGTTIRGTATDNGGSGLNNTQLFIDGVPVTVSGALWSYNWVYPPNTFHTYSIYTQASDVAGNVEVLPPGAGINVVVDNIAPTSTINPLPPYITGTGNYTFTGDATDTGVGIARVQVSVNNAPWTDATGTTAWSYAWAIPADGTYSLAVRAIDGAGNIQAVPTTATPVVNNGPPVVTIAEPAPDASIRTSTFTITGTAADPGAGIKRVELSIDGGAWNTATYNGVTGTWSYLWTIPPQEKKYTIQARATDNSNDTSTTAVITVTYDVTAPISAIVLPAANALLNGTAYTITGTGLDPVSPAGQRSGLQAVQVSFDGGTVWYPATTGDEWATWSYNWILPLTESHLTIKSRAIDKAGNIQAAPFAALVHVYQVPPTSTITSPANGAFLNGASRTITGTSTDLGLGIDFVEISTDGGATWNLATGAATWSYTWNLPGDGAYTILAKATDLVGYVEAAPYTITVTVDNTLPDTGILSQPLLYSNIASPSFTFSSNEPGTFQCKLDGGTYTACTSPFTYSGLADGSHTFTVRAIDRAGNIDLSPSTYTWTVDTVAPSVSNPSPADGATRISVSSLVTVTFSEAMDPATITTSTFTLDYVPTTNEPPILKRMTGTVSYDPATRVATLSAVPLKYATTYTATVTTGVKDLAGNPLSSPLVWTFETDPDGDFDLDGDVDIYDAVLCLRAVVHGTTLTPNQFRHVNVAPLKNGKPYPNGSVTIGDAVVILERVVKKSVW